GFFLALEADPGDVVTMKALADWYEDHSHPLEAACLRWLIERKRWPYRYERQSGQVNVSCRTWNDNWMWWALDTRSYGGDWGHPAECRLPDELWKHLPHSFKYDPAVFKEYPTCRAAYQAVFAAWPRFPPASRGPAKP